MKKGKDINFKVSKRIYTLLDEYTIAKELLRYNDKELDIIRNEFIKEFQKINKEEIKKYKKLD